MVTAVKYHSCVSKLSQEKERVRINPFTGSYFSVSSSHLKNSLCHTMAFWADNTQ